MAWRGISGNVRVLLCVKATADLLRPLTLKRDLASPDCGAFSGASLDLMFPAFTTPACSLSPRIQHSPLPSSTTRTLAESTLGQSRLSTALFDEARGGEGGGDGDPAGLIPVVNEVEWEVGGRQGGADIFVCAHWADRNVCHTFSDTLKRGLRTGEGIDGPRNTHKNAKINLPFVSFRVFRG
jgi:hypothetical protein